MIVLTANSQALLDLKTMRIVANFGKEYQNKFYIFADATIKGEIKGTAIEVFDKKSDAVAFLKILRDELNSRWYPARE